MRTIPHEISERVGRTMQTTANNSNPSSDIWINRPYTALVSDVFLERQKIMDTPVTDVSVAVCHPRFKADNTMVYVGYVADGKARIMSAVTKTKMEEHIWLNEDFEEDATCISVAFDGSMVMGVDKRVEFISETIPWIFWANEEGTLYARKLGDDGEPVNLAVSNCVDVSVVSSSDDSVGSFDFGLIVFFVMGGSLFYRQLIDGVWMDGEQVVSAPTDIVKIAAFRSWDYRVGVQMQTADGKVYEIFTQYMGIGKRNVEHLDIKDVYASGHMTEILRYDAVHIEHIDVGRVVSNGDLYWGRTCVPVSVENIPDENDDYGYYVKVILDHPVLPMTGHESQFTMIDTFGITYGCSEIILAEDGVTATFKFSNFNVSEGNDLTIYYVAGDDPIRGPGAPVTDFEFTFTPTGLVRPDIPLPEPLVARVMDTGGTTLELEFTESLIPETIDGNLGAFTITMSEYNMVPGGTLGNKNRVATSISLREDNDKVLVLTFASGNVNSLQNGENVTINYANGRICGYGGPVVFFEFEFILEGLIKKNNPNDMEHLEIGNVTAKGSLKKIVYHEFMEPGEHCATVTDIYGEGKLTHIDDL